MTELTKEQQILRMVRTEVLLEMTEKGYKKLPRTVGKFFMRAISKDKRVSVHGVIDFKNWLESVTAN